ncbi:unnamed protein product, partial [Hapterophycus canaliculatus]
MHSSTAQVGESGPEGRVDGRARSFLAVDTAKPLHYSHVATRVYSSKREKSRDQHLRVSCEGTVVVGRINGHLEECLSELFRCEKVFIRTTFLLKIENSPRRTAIDGLHC